MLFAALAALAVVLAALGLSLFEHYATAAREQGSQHHLAAEFAAALARRSPGPPVPGTVLGLLDSPRLGIKGLAVVEGATLRQLRRGPAHDPGTTQPGQRGAVVIIGHHQTYGGPFGRIGALRLGDVITLRTPSSLYVYRVSRAPAVLQAGTRELQLPSATEVRASGGATEQVDQVLVLATGVGSRGTSMQVVMATLDPASASGTTRPAAGGIGAQLRSVPGERVGLVLVLFWAAILGGIVYLFPRLRPKAPPLPLAVATFVVVSLALYQVYLAVDRMLPGTY